MEIKPFTSSVHECSHAANVGTERWNREVLFMYFGRHAEAYDLIVKLLDGPQAEFEFFVTDNIFEFH